MGLNIFFSIIEFGVKNRVELEMSSEMCNLSDGDEVYIYHFPFVIFQNLFALPKFLISSIFG